MGQLRQDNFVGGLGKGVVHGVVENLQLQPLLFDKLQTRPRLVGRGFQLL